MRALALMLWGSVLGGCGGVAGPPAIMTDPVPSPHEATSALVSPPPVSQTVTQKRLPPTLPSVPGAPVAPPSILYLNASGGTLFGRYDDAAHDASSVVAAAGRAQLVVPLFRGSAADWQQVVACVRKEFSRFRVVVTETRPTSGPYTMVMFGGDGAALGYPRQVGGAAPIDAQECRTLEDAVVLVFSDNFGGNVDGICEIAAQEISHTFSLDHELLADDPMSYLPATAHKTFQDVTAPCGEFQQRPCVCGRPSQNSVELLTARLGLAE